MQDDFLGGFLGAKLACVNDDVSVSRGFVRIRNAGKFLENSRPCLCIGAVAFALLESLYCCRDVTQDEPAMRLNRLSHMLTCGVIRSDRCADSNAAILCNF